MPLKLSVQKNSKTMTHSETIPYVRFGNILMEIRLKKPQNPARKFLSALFWKFRVQGIQKSHPRLVLRSLSKTVADSISKSKVPKPNTGLPPDDDDDDDDALRYSLSLRKIDFIQSLMTFGKVSTKASKIGVSTNKNQNSAFLVFVCTDSYFTCFSEYKQKPK